MTPLEALIAGRARILDPAHWVQGDYCVDKQGCKCPDDVAVRWCAAGALGTGFDDAYPHLESAAQTIFSMSATEVNDTLGHGPTLKMYDLAIAKLEARA